MHIVLFAIVLEVLSLRKYHCQKTHFTMGKKVRSENKMTLKEKLTGKEDVSFNPENNFLNLGIVSLLVV